MKKYRFYLVAGHIRDNFRRVYEGDFNNDAEALECLIGAYSDLNFDTIRIKTEYEVSEIWVFFA